MEQKKNYTLPIIMMFLLFAMISFVTGLSNPLGVIVKNQFAVANWMSQLGNFANFIAYAVMGIPAGMMLKRIGYKKTALAAVAIGFVGVGIQYLSGEAGSFPIYLIGAFVSGFSMCMLNTVVNPMLNTLGGGGKKGNQLIQFGGSLNSISATIVPVFVGYLMGNVATATINKANPALFIAIGIFALAFIVLYFMQIPEPAQEIEAQKESAEGVKDPHSALSFRHFILGAVAIFLYVGVEVGIPNFVNLFLSTPVDAVDSVPGLGYEAALAGSICGTYWFLMLIGRLFGGFLGAKFSSKAMLTFVSLLGLLFVLLAIFLPETIKVDMPVFQSDISFGLAEVPIGIMFLILCGLIPKLGAIVSIMPQSVLGGAAVMMFSSIVVSGIQLITKEKMTSRNLTIVSVALGVGYGMGAHATILSKMPEAIQLVFGGSGIVPAAFMAIILNVLLPKDEA